MYGNVKLNFVIFHAIIPLQDFSGAAFLKIMFDINLYTKS